jgi:hypothetical protein
MLKRCHLLVLAIFCLISCAHQRSKSSLDSLPSQIKTEHRKFSSLSRVEVQGQINVTLHTGYKKPQIVLKGDPRDLEQVKTVVSDNGLLLFLGRGYPQYGQLHADIQAQNLSFFKYKGAGLVDGSRLHTRFLNLYLENQGSTKLGGSLGLSRLEIVGKNNFTEISGINSPNLQLYFVGSPRVQLSGFATITNVVLNGSVWFSFYWIKSDFLTIRAKNKSNIQLAGTVNKLDVELWGNAQFRGRYLRAHRSFVKTHGRSLAEVSSVNHQSTLATDASDIYYYNLPTTREDFMAYSGSVLDMREWDSMTLRDFDRYNKQFP